ncbi:MAG: hypothetical protein JXQ75_21120 [Phycisphaerae bacterium]|nr:hypothetical protein [Phycisphaerae bacterium]
MNRRTGFLVVACLVGCAGLAASGCRQADKDRWDEFVAKMGGSGSSDGGLFGSRRAGEQEVWTIECNAYRGPQRRVMADRMASALKRVGELRSGKVAVEHRKNQSVVYYGEYKLKYVEAKVDSASHAKGDVVIELNDAIQRDLQFIKTLALGEAYPFFSARPLPKPIEDVGPAEWDLRSAKGVYTLQVGVTYNTPTLHDYKQAAVEWVKALRAEGHEAYYYHDPDKPRSSVCVGTFGEDALVDSGDGKTRYSDAVNALRKQGDFMYNLENGHKIYKRAPNSETGRIERMPNWSFLVRIPQGGAESERDDL